MVGVSSAFVYNVVNVSKIVVVSSTKTVLIFHFLL